MDPDAAPRTRGRPVEFDRDDVVDRVTELFWTRGYNRTGMNDIVEATGLNKSSIYNTFGSKDALFCEVLRRYNANLGKSLAQVGEGSAGLADLHSMLDLQLERLEQSLEARGCLMLNSGMELGPSNLHVCEEGCGHRSRMRDAFRSALLRAVDLGEIQRERVEPAVELMVGLFLATPLLERSGADLDELRAYLGAQHDFIETLRK